MNAFYQILPSAGDWILTFLTLNNRSKTDWLVNDKTSHKLPSLIVLNESAVMQVCSTYFLFLRSQPSSHQPWSISLYHCIIQRNCLIGDITGAKWSNPLSNYTKTLEKMGWKLQLVS